MMFTNEVVFGTVTACDPDNNLTVALENGETGRVTADEIGRRELKEGVNLTWMVGRRFGYHAGEKDEQGFRLLSGKAYENAVYDDIVRRFRSGERNVYTGRLTSRTRDGKYVFYSLAQGVNGAVNVCDFSYARIADFNAVDLPQELTVVIKNVDDLGRIQLSAKPAFGSFADSVRRLDIREGSIVDGRVSGHVPSNHDAVVTLAPNLTILTNNAELGRWVKVQITRVNMEEQRLKGQIVELHDASFKPFRYEAWNAPADSLPAFIDLEAFEKSIGPRSRTASPVVPAAPKPIEISYETAAVSSPYALREGESCVRAPLNGSNRGRVLFESQQGYLSANHMLVAQAVNELKYTTAWQLQRFLHLKHNVVLTETTLQSILTRLTRLDIVHFLRFSLDGHVSGQHVYYPGAALMQCYTGQRRNLPDVAYTAEPDPVRIKWQLSANQLMIAMMHTHPGFKEVCSSNYFKNEEGVRVHPLHKLVTASGDVYYLESARSNWIDDSLDKLQRYSAYLTSVGEKARVMITLEDESMIPDYMSKVIALHLNIPVYLTCDLDCLPTVTATEIPAWTQDELSAGGSAPVSERRSGFLSRIRGLFKEQKTA